MDAVKFLQERNRMFLSGSATPSIGLEDDFDPVMAVEIVEKWSEQHPRRTRQSVFLEQYPNARIDRQAVIYVCPADACGDKICPKNKENFHMRCCDCRREFWMQTVDGLREQYGVNPNSFGKPVFLTRGEAEKALEAMKK
nr:MAG TPA: cysteine-rich protein [Caudoviricetes sp.]